MVRNKNVVRLTESELKQIINESVYQYIMENAEDELLGGLGALASGAWNKIKQWGSNVKQTYQQGEAQANNKKIMNYLYQLLQNGTFGQDPQAKTCVDTLVNLMNATFKARFNNQGGGNNSGGTQPDTTTQGGGAQGGANTPPQTGGAPQQ